MKAPCITLAIAALLLSGGAVRAQFSGGSGTVGDPYLIASSADLNAIRGAYLGATGSPKHYRQTADISLTGIPNWAPIGSLATNAYVHYDGNHKRISDLTITRAAENIVGLFGLLNGSVRDLTLASGTVSGGWYVGTLAGRLDNGTLENCLSLVSVTGVNNVGGLVGWNQGGTLRRSSVRQGAVTGTNTVGGLVGYNSGGTLDTCYAAAPVTAGANAGGLAGLQGGGTTVTGSYWDTTVSGQGASAGGGTGVATAGMKQRATFAGWNFDSVWRLYEGQSYPYLQASAEGVADPVPDPSGGTLPGTGTLVSVTCATPGAAIHYTTDGSVPGDTSPSVASGGTVAVPVPGRLRAVAWVAYRNPSALVDAEFFAAPKVPSPQLSPGAGSYVGTSVTVTVTCATNDATLRYTLDGSTPEEGTPATVANGGTVAVPIPGTLTVRAFRVDLNPSEASQAVYSTADTVGAPVLAPSGGTYPGTGLAVTVTCSTGGATIRYTLDGSDPQDGVSPSVVSGGIVQVPLATATNRLMARAFHPDLNPSAVTTGVYLRAPAAAVPALDPPGGTFAASHALVTLVSTTAGATIRYTLDGADPDANTPHAVTNGGTVAVPVAVGGTTLKARAFHADYNPSALTQAVYSAADPVATPLFTPVSGQPTGTVMVTCATTGATIRYTTDGSMPMADGLIVTNGGVVTVPVPGTLKARAWKTNMFTSPVRTAYYGDFAGGSGNAADPFRIATATHLSNVRNHLSSNFLLVADIDLGEGNWSVAPGWEPIGTFISGQPGARFSGRLDGHGHVVSNLFIDRQGSAFIGLFGLIATNGSVVNLGIQGGSVSGMDYVGALAGYNEGTISNCFAQADVIGNIFQLAGGAGGLVGRGAASGTVRNSHATGTVNGPMNLGGLVGYSQSTVVNCYAAVAVASATDAGGLIGKYVSGTVTASFWDVEASGRATTGGNQGSGRTTAQMRQQATFTGWNFDAIWMIEEGTDYPALQVFDKDVFRIPDDWLIRYYGSVDDAPARSVKGSLLLHEYIAGTDPTDHDSVFAVVEAALQPAALHLSVPSVTGRLYRVQSRANLMTGPEWVDVAGVDEQSGTGAVLVFEVPLPAMQTFYRLSVELAD